MTRERNLCGRWAPPCTCTFPGRVLQRVLRIPSGNGETSYSLFYPSRCHPALPSLSLELVPDKIRASLLNIGFRWRDSITQSFPHWCSPNCRIHTQKDWLQSRSRYCKRETFGIGSWTRDNTSRSCRGSRRVRSRIRTWHCSLQIHLLSCRLLSLLE